MRQLRETVASLTAQCAQLEEANRAWQLYQQSQTEMFRNTLQDYLPVDENLSLNQVAEQIIEQVIKEREDFDKKYGELEKLNSSLQSGN